MFTAIVTDVPNGYTYKTALVHCSKLAKKLGHDFVNRKNIDYATIDVVKVNIL